jgi:hypothetical protein
MSNPNHLVEGAKAEWTAPKLVELNLNMEHVESGYDPGTDGAGGYATSES